MRQAGSAIGRCGFQLLRRPLAYPFGGQDGYRLALARCGRRQGNSRSSHGTVAPSPGRTRSMLTAMNQSNRLGSQVRALP